MEQDAPWDEIASAYAELSIPVAEILTRYGLTRAELLAAARARQWPSRTERARLGARTSKRAEKAERLKATAGQCPAKASAGVARRRIEPRASSRTSERRRVQVVHPRALVKRIYNTIDKELSKLEEHDGDSSQDRERASRALSQMVSSLEKAVEMQREIARDAGRKETAGKDKEALKHAEELRREIADRLERLHRKRTAAK